MEQWNSWFAAIAGRQIDQAGFTGGREITAAGTADLPWDQNCIMGYNIIKAESLGEAGQLAQGNHFVSGIRIYELR